MLSASSMSLARQARARHYNVFAAVARSSTDPFSVEQLKLAAPQSNEVSVRVVSTGICHTDVHVKRHGFCAFPAVLGHEGTGVVEEVGHAVVGLEKGDHVLMTYSACGSCSPCHMAKPAYCVEHGSLNFAGSRPDGSKTLHTEDGKEVTSNFFQQSSFATRVLARQDNVVKIPKDLPLGMFAPLGCGVQTGSGAVLNTFDARPGSTIAIFGCGAVGLSAVIAARQIASCSRVIAVDVNGERLALAKELGATDTHQLSLGPDDREETVAMVMQATGGQGVHFALDTSGQSSSMQTGVAALASMGVFGMVAPGGPGQTVELETLSLLAGKQFRGIVQGDAVAAMFIPQLLQHWKEGKLPFEKFCKEYDGLDSINEAVADMGKGSTIKPILRLMPDPAV